MAEMSSRSTASLNTNGLLSDVSMPPDLPPACSRDRSLLILSFSPSRQSSDSTRVKGSPRGTECVPLHLPLFSTNKTLVIYPESSALAGLHLLPTQVIPCHPGERGVRRAFSRMLHACMHLDKPSLPQEGFTLTGMANFKPFVMMCMPRNQTSLVSLRMQGSQALRIHRHKFHSRK